MQQTIAHRYLHLPVRDGAPMRHIRLRDGDTVLYAFDIELAEGEPDFWVSADLWPWVGRNVIVDVDGDEDEPALQILVPADYPAGRDEAYGEPLRPRYHFTARRGWNNDPNGLLYYQGEYHLFFQHNPFGRRWGNMHWGHAVSADLIHWRELGEALHPDASGTMFSGCGLVDWHNTSSLGAAGAPPLICVYTAAGGRSLESQGQPFTQCLAFSNDRGRTWAKYHGNPVLGHVAGANRDPKVVWHAESERWVVALYLEGHTYGLYSSPDLIHWQEESRLEMDDGTECPDLFMLAVDGDLEQMKWVFWAANGEYRVGDFDGRAFHSDGRVWRFYHGGDAYAAQTWSDAPHDRRLQIAWLRGDIPGMPFNQQMTFPTELTLRATAAGPRLHAQPVRELALLYRDSYAWPEVALRDLAQATSGLTGDAYHLKAMVEARGSWCLNVRGLPLQYDAAAGEVSLGKCRAALDASGPVKLEVLLDRASIEVFLDDGRLYFPLSNVFQPAYDVPLIGGEGDGRLLSLEVHQLGSIHR